MRRATYARFGIWVSVSISIHALHEESDASVVALPALRDISIHALHEESDLTAYHQSPANALFQSTLSMRRATKHGQIDAVITDFNPRSP